MALLILRIIFMIVAVGIGAFLANRSPPVNSWQPWVAFLTVMFVAGIVLAVDWLVKKKRIDVISAIYFGTIVGVFLSYVLGLALNPILPLKNPPDPNLEQIREAVQLVLAMVLVYLCISVLLQTRDDFRFVIPYVEFVREVKGFKPFLLDTSVILDGRINDIVATGFINNQLIVPQFIIAELQQIADSSDRQRRGRGRRGLELLNSLRDHEMVDFRVYDRDLPELQKHPVDHKLVLLAKHLDGKVITNDYSLNKVAKLHDVEVINLHDLANALKSAHIPGDELSLYIMKPGEGNEQGVGYLDDGTMVVVEGGRRHLNETVQVTVKNTIQRSTGRIIFAHLEAA